MLSPEAPDKLKVVMQALSQIYGLKFEFVNKVEEFF
jgi:hypothetical protein